MLIPKSGYHDGKLAVSRDIGSGVVFDEQGHILTNFHVAGRAIEIHVTLADKQRVAARLIGVDHWTDLAVVQLDLDDVHAKHADFSFVPFGESSSLIPGQDVMAVGTPFGLARTMTLGTISTVERTLYPQRLDIEGYETGDYSNWVQMDVPINPGNSGGPLPGAVLARQSCREYRKCTRIIMTRGWRSLAFQTTLMSMR
jgi:serine protease Do